MEIKCRTTLLLAAFGVAPILAAADNPSDLPVVEILGERYYLYQSRKGDSLYGIARQFGWDEDTLARLNSKVTTPLKKGVNIYYPAPDSGAEADGALTVGGMSTPELPSAGEMEEYYEIRTGDTLYSLARRRNTTVAEIMKLNPGISERNFRAGEKIRLPEEGSGVVTEMRNVEETRLEMFDTYKVGRDESWSGVSRKTGVPVSDLKEANPGVDRLKNKMVIFIPKLSTVEVEREVAAEDPREQTSEGRSEIYEEIHYLPETSESAVKVAILLDDPAGKRDIEYTRGFFAALDRMKNSGGRYEVKVLDGSLAPDSVRGELESFRPGLLFLTAEKSVPEYLAGFARDCCVPVVNVFDVKNEEYLTNPYFIQLLTPSAEFNNGIATYIYDNYKGYTLLMAGGEDSDDALAEALRSLWDERDVKRVSLENLGNYSLSDRSRVLIYGNPTRKGDVATLLEGVKKLKEDVPFASIELLGRPNWIVYDEALASDLGATGAMIPSRFYYDAEAPDTRIFVATYKDLFGNEPKKSFPMYGAVGYDTALYFLSGLKRTGGDINAIPSSNGLVQSDYKLRRESNWSGMMNPTVYLVRFNSYGAPDKIKVNGR